MLKHGLLIALNITVSDSGRDIITNKTPILYYYVGESLDKIKESMFSNNNIIDLIKKSIANSETYMNGSVNYVSFSLDSEDEDYIEDSVMVQDVLGINSFPSIKASIIDNIALEIYFEVFNAKYTNQSNCDSILCDVYDKVSIMYKDGITTNTFVNLMRKHLQQLPLSKSNIQEVVDEAATTLDTKNHLSLRNE